MLPFAVTLVPGQSPARQIVFAATRAIVSGELPPGATFPSVRELSLALRINPNTAHKVVAELVRAGLLEVLPGVGTTVAARARRVSAAERQALLSGEVEHLVVEARRLGLNRDELLTAVGARWSALFPAEPSAAPRQRAARPRVRPPEKK